MADDSLKRRVTSGLRWTAITRGLTQLLTWFATLIVVRLLSPSDYGLVALATLVSSYLMIVGEMGLSAALIQRRELDAATQQAVLGVLLVGGVSLFGITVLLAPMVSSLFAEPRLVPLVVMVGVQFLILPFTVIPQATLARQLRFGALGAAGTAAAACGALATVLCAWLQLGSYALVGGILVTMFVRAVALNALAPFPYWPRLEWQRVAGFASFSRYVLLERTVWYWYAEFDTVLAGWLFGAPGVGLYSVAKQISVLASERFAEVMNTVATPAYASIQEDLARVGELYIKTLRLAAIGAFPAFWGLAVVAPELVPLLLGAQWVEAVPILQLLCIAMPLRTVGTLSPAMLVAIGQPDATFRCTLISASVVGTAIVIGAHWGLVGIASAWAVGYPLAFAINTRLVGSAIGRRPFAIVEVLATPALCAAFMVLIVLSARYFLLPKVPPSVLLAAVVLCGTLSYIALSWVVSPRNAREFRDFIRSLAGR